MWRKFDINKLHFESFKNSNIFRKLTGILKWLFFLTLKSFDFCKIIILTCKCYIYNMTKIQNESLLEIPINSLFFNCPGRLSYLAACCLFPCILNTDAECSLNDIATTSTHHNAVCNSMAYIKELDKCSVIKLHSVRSWGDYFIIRSNAN